jgi:hypothetical protein
VRADTVAGRRALWSLAVIGAGGVGAVASKRLAKIVGYDSTGAAVPVRLSVQAVPLMQCASLSTSSKRKRLNVFSFILYHL